MPPSRAVSRLRVTACSGWPLRDDRRQGMATLPAWMPPAVKPLLAEPAADVKPIGTSPWREASGDHRVVDDDAPEPARPEGLVRSHPPSRALSTSGRTDWKETPASRVVLSEICIQVSDSVLQNKNFTASWTTRGSPAEVIVPNAADPTVVLGAWKGGVFVTLNTSTRNSRALVPESSTRRITARSRLR